MRLSLEQQAKQAKIIKLDRQCSQDPILFFNTFLFTFDPKRPPFHWPFNLFPFQDNLVNELVRHIEQGRDIFIDKCREMGATYTVLGTLLWYWRYREASNFLLGSRREGLVDNVGGDRTESTNKEESLFGKLDYMIDRIPSLALPISFLKEKHRTYMNITNPELGNIISGEAGGPNFSRGGRQRAIMMDEFAFWENDCLIKDTEILTDSGWRLVKDCTIRDQVYSMDIDTGKALLMPITKVHKVYAEKLYGFKGKSVNISCTPNHKLLLKKKRKPLGTRQFTNKNKDKTRYQQSSSLMYFRRADEVFDQKHDFIPLTSDYTGGDNPELIYGYVAEDFMEFLGWFISEGWSSNKPGTRRIGIAQRDAANPEKVELIKSLLKRMQLPIFYNGDQFSLSMGRVPKELFDELCSLGKAHEKYIPRRYLNMSKDLLLCLFDSLIKGDGCRTIRSGRVDKLAYSTVSKRLSDDVQELVQKIGLRATISEREQANQNWRRLYILNIGFKPHAQVSQLNKEIVDYNDYAYCVTTPYHSLYIRRNGIASWCGNTSAWGSTADTTNCRIVLTTPGIRGNTKAKRLRFGKDGEKIDVITLDHTLDPRKDRAWIEKERDRRSSDDFAREIMINWDGSTAGVVYPEARHRDVGDFPYMPNKPIYVSWDFGLDGTAIQWWQRNPNNNKMRLIDAFMKENMPIQWFFPLFGRGFNSMFQYSTDELDAIDRVKFIVGAIHYGDPDVSKRSMTSAVLTSVREELANVGIHVFTNTEANTFVNRRERTKIMLQRGIEVNNTPGTEVWIECIDNARYPQRTDNNQATTPVPAPVHDYTSHHRTSTEYFAVNYLEDPDNRGAVSAPNAPRQQDLLIGNMPLGDSISNVLNRGNNQGQHWML